MPEVVHHATHDALFTAMAAGSKEGEMWVGTDGPYYTKPEITWEKIRDLSRNHLVTEQLERLTSLLFMARPEYAVVDMDETMSGKPREVEDVSEDMAAMFNAQGVQLHEAMKKAWADIFVWGAYLANPVWTRDKSKVTLTKLRRLPPESFGEGGQGAQSTPGRIYSQILQGITLKDPEDEDSVLFFQEQAESGAPKELKNVWMVTDPASGELAGSSKLAPLVPIIEMYDFAMKALMQAVNRAGAPIMFIRFTQQPAPVTDDRDDIKLAQKIVRNWGKDTAYLLRDNMEPHMLDTRPTTVSKDAIEYLEGRIKHYMSPSTIISTEGPTLGEGTGAKLDVLTEWMKGQHEMIETPFEELGNMWLEHNAFPDNLRTDINLPEPEPSDTAMDIQLATAMHQTNSGTLDERREKLGLKLLDARTRKLLDEENKAKQPPSPFGAVFPGFPPPTPTPQESAQFQADFLPDPELTKALEIAAKVAKDRIIGAAEHEAEGDEQ